MYNERHLGAILIIATSFKIEAGEIQLQGEKM